MAVLPSGGVKKRLGFRNSPSPPPLSLFRPVPFLTNFTKRVSYKELFELLPVKYLRSKDLKLNDPLQIQTHPITTNTSSACFFTCGKLLIQWIMLFYSPYYTIIVWEVFPTSQHVSMGGQNFKYFPMKCVVIQGSILGPLIFLLYINDLPNMDATETYLILLMTVPLSIATTTKIIINMINTLIVELNRVSYLLLANNLIINIKSLIWYSTAIYILSHNSDKQYFLLKCKKSTYLGVTVQQQLLWDSHNSFIRTKVSKQCGMIIVIRDSLVQRLWKLIYYVLTCPFLYYSLTVWGGACKEPIKNFCDHAETNSKN